MSVSAINVPHNHHLSTDILQKLKLNWTTAWRNKKNTEPLPVAAGPSQQHIMHNHQQTKKGDYGLFRCTHCFTVDDIYTDRMLTCARQRAAQTSMYVNVELTQSTKSQTRVP